MPHCLPLPSMEARCLSSMEACCLLQPGHTELGQRGQGHLPQAPQSPHSRLQGKAGQCTLLAMHQPPFPLLLPPVSNPLCMRTKRMWAWMMGRRRRRKKRGLKGLGQRVLGLGLAREQPSMDCASPSQCGACCLQWAGHRSLPVQPLPLPRQVVCVGPANSSFITHKQLCFGRGPAPPS